MGNLIKAELFKLRKSLAYKLLLSSFFVFEIIFIRNELNIGVMHTGVVYTGAEWLYKMPALASYYIVFLFIFAADYVAGEFTKRTYAASFRCGYPRKAVLWAKALVFFIGELPFLVIHAVTGTVIWSLRFGFGMKLSTDLAVLIAKSLVYCVLGFLVFGYISFLIAIIAKNAIGTVGWCLGVVQTLGICAANAMSIKYPVIKKIVTTIFQYTVYYQLGNLNNGEFSWVSLGVSVLSSLLWVLLILAAAKAVFQKCEIK